MDFQSQYVYMHRELYTLGPVRMRVPFFENLIRSADLLLRGVKLREVQLKRLLKARS